MVVLLDFRPVRIQLLEDFTSPYLTYRPANNSPPTGQIAVEARALSREFHRCATRTPSCYHARHVLHIPHRAIASDRYNRAGRGSDPRAAGRCTAARASTTTRRSRLLRLSRCGFARTPAESLASTLEESIFAAAAARPAPEAAATRAPRAADADTGAAHPTRPRAARRSASREWPRSVPPAPARTCAQGVRHTPDRARCGRQCRTAWWLPTSTTVARLPRRHG